MKKAIKGYIISHILCLTGITIIAVCSTSLCEEESLPSEIINDVKQMEIISSAHAAITAAYFAMIYLLRYKRHWRYCK